MASLGPRPDVPADKLQAALREVVMASHALEVSARHFHETPDPEARRAFLAAMAHELDALVRAERVRTRAAGARGRGR